MAYIKGQDLLISLNDTVIAACKSCDIEADCDLLEVSSPSSSDYRTYRPGRKSWRVQVNHLIPTSGLGVLTVKNIGTSYTLKAYVRGNPSVDKIEGTAILKTARRTGTWGNLMQGQWSFVGSGDI